MPRMPLNIVYASDLTIKDPSLLATLAVFYDKIYLPHAYDLDPDATPLMRWPGKHMDDLEMLQRGYKKWKDHWKPLFEAGVIEVLPAAFPSGEREPPDVEERLLNELGIKAPFFGSSDVFEGRIALAMHALFTRTSDPEFLLKRPGATDTRHLQGALATSLIQYRIPKIGEMTPEQLLRIRTETGPDKEGFIHYVNQLIDDVEDRLPTVAGDEREAARRTIERKIDPELAEYLRQEKLRVEKSLVKILNYCAKGVEKAMDIVLMPWNYRNYTEASELLLDGADELIEGKLQQAGNKHRAFQFIASIEKVQG